WDKGDGFLLLYDDTFADTSPTKGCVGAGDDFNWNLNANGDATGGSRTLGVSIAKGHKLHVVATTSAEKTAIGTYTLYVENAFEASGEAAEPNSSVTTAGSAGGPTDVAGGSLSASTDADWFTFAATGGVRYRLEANAGSATECNGNAVNKTGNDTFLAVRDTI